MATKRDPKDTKSTSKQETDDVEMHGKARSKVRGNTDRSKVRGKAR